MIVGITGSGGLVGSALVTSLTGDGHRVLRLVRRNTDRTDEIPWFPERAQLDPEQLADLDVIVHLAGENVASGRWTQSRKQRIRESRVQGTSLLAQALSKSSKRPVTLIMASAIGGYGNSGDHFVKEDAFEGDGFLAEVCREWEAASRPAEDAGVRVVQMRFGAILSRHGGALRKMLTPFRLGLGGRIGSGRQWMSWISLRDVIRGIRFAAAQDSMRGAYNTVSPNPIRNVGFTRALAEAVHRPACLPVPAFLLRAALGQMADEMLLSSTRAEAGRLEKAGFKFRDPLLAAFLREEVR